MSSTKRTPEHSLRAYDLPAKEAAAVVAVEAVGVAEAVAVAEAAPRPAEAVAAVEAVPAPAVAEAVATVAAEAAAAAAEAAAAASEFGGAAAAAAEVETAGYGPNGAGFGLANESLSERKNIRRARELRPSSREGASADKRERNSCAYRGLRRNGARTCGRR